MEPVVFCEQYNESISQIYNNLFSIKRKSTNSQIHKRIFSNDSYWIIYQKVYNMEYVSYYY